MKSSFIALVLSVFASAALAAPTGDASSMMTDRQMKAMSILYQNKAALGLNGEEMQQFDNLMAGLHKRDLSEGISASISTGTIDELLQQLGGTTDKLTKALDVLKSSKKDKREEDAVDISEALEADLKKDPTKGLTDVLGKLQKAKKPKRDEEALEISEALDADMKMDPTKALTDLLGMLQKQQKGKREVEAFDAGKKDKKPKSGLLGGSLIPGLL